MVTPDEYNEICKLVCPHCAKNLEAKFRAATNEWIHDTAAGGFMSFSICWASGLRKSKYNPENRLGSND